MNVIRSEKHSIPPHQQSLFAPLLLTLGLFFLSACTTTTVDEYRESPVQLSMDGNDTVVILGRRHAGQYETEPKFIECIGEELSQAETVSVLPEQDFIDSLYPWFEPRTAPLGLRRLETMLADPLIGQSILSRGVHYMIWIDGSTSTTDSDGSISCAFSGCFGFATWEKTAHYEAIIWDLDKLDERGRVNVDAKGSSYLIAIGAPIPIIAQVQDEACEGIGQQLRSFFTTD